MAKRADGARRKPGNPPPEVVVERTNLGPDLDEFVAELKRRQKPLGVNPDYDLLRDNFDHVNFVLQALLKSRVTSNDPVGVYLRNGVEALNNPDINFSMAAYLARYPERRESGEHPYLAWLKHGRGAGEIADPAPEIERMANVLDLAPDELVDALVERRTDLQRRLRTGKLGEMFARAAEIDPLVAGAWPECSRPSLVPMTTAITVRQMAALHASHAEARFRRARVLLVVDSARSGGDRRMEAQIAHALASQIAAEEIVVIYTDGGGVPPAGRFPAGVRGVDFAAQVADMEAAWQEHTLVMLVRSFHAESIVNIDSGTFHRAMRTYGSALAATERLFPIFFGNESTEIGDWYGWPSIQFYRLFDQVTNIITDSERLAQWLDDIYQLDPGSREKIRIFHAPVDPTLPLASPDVSSRSSDRPTVFWAARSGGRKEGIDLVLQIARLMPEVEFRLWGEQILQRRRLKHLPENVRIEGGYAAFTDLELGEADVWLYTSAWDGVPTILLDVAMTGVPIVGRLVGGTGEVLSEADAWPVAEIGNAEEFVKAIREVLADTAGARRRALALRERLLRERSEAAFAEEVTGLLLVEGEGKA
ncbi:MAG TPA: glycosyltransferase [Gaiellaceae bacterium]|nr:glycosyltransferase [Gaiellaceae bacterium]